MADCTANRDTGYVTDLAGKGVNRNRDNEKSASSGNRQRRRSDFLSSEPFTSSQIELLELLLYNAIPHSDVRPTANRLMSRFGNFSSIFSAAPEKLREIEGLNESIIFQLRLTHDIVYQISRSEISGRSAISSWDSLLRYCHVSMASESVEQFRIIFLDRKNRIINDEVRSIGTVDHVPIYPREVAKRSLELNASALILVHNHPSGDPTPSHADIAMTRRVEEACNAIGVVIHDHLIIGKYGNVSLRELGHI